MVVSASHYASKAGLEILKKGGNAVDAAVAVQFALAVVYPNAGNLGGGGFMVYRAAGGETASLDFREKAAAAAHKDMYLDSLANPIVEKSLYGHLAAGVPGSVAGMETAHKRFGKLPWSELLKPAISLATEGFQVTSRQAAELNGQAYRFHRHNALGTALLKGSGSWKEGDLLVQEDLAATLRHIAERGAAGFYEGPVAALIIEEMQRGGGIISAADLKAYRAVWRQPVTGTYRGLKIITMPPPSSGGIALLQLLQSVEPYPLQRLGFNSDSTVQLMVEAERRVYADRAAHLGDPDYHPVPQKQLLAAGYNKQRMSGFDWSKAGSSAAIAAGLAAPAEHEETTHFSIVDRAGNAVSITTTLNGSYGSHVVVKGAGFLLNNEMDDFSVKPGAPNMYGLVGGAANAIAPGKRMLSSMTPTIVEKDGKLFMVLGTPGGSTIITSVFQTILNVVDFGMGMQAAVNARKIHHQWLPDEVFLEKGAVDSTARQRLTQKGYRFTERGAIGRVDAILKTKWGYYEAGADPRGDDAAAGW
ncbi:gamma-glutamyltransferase [Pedobacter yulinensis]|uniref:Glutathione hydrolase proenzyme n=2 Tax=Pedobacter yulinensis TaxID=2126353 RepID=A0A2T3HQ72_9SPHI|nr:gamma-glutamyltransferase [Pedobacter yulinensis]